jgi:hypothetical protein
MKKNLSIFLSLLVIVIFMACGSDNTAENSDAETTEEGMLSADQAAAGQGSLVDAANAGAMGDVAAPPADAQMMAPPAGPTTTVSFPSGMEYDFGTIEAGKKISHKYKLKNTGSEPLLISNCKASCGCTVPKCPTEPIAPGETAEIPVEYDSKGKNGPDQKTITITANTNPSPIVLTIKGNVKGSTPEVQAN